jgi:hypothetical protein
MYWAISFFIGQIYLFMIGPTNENGCVHDVLEGTIKMNKGGIQQNKVWVYIFSTSTNN